MLKGLISVIDDRTGIPSFVKKFLDEDIPASAGWHQVFGSVALFAFLIQVATGFLLALNYGATPDDAHASVRYIMTQVTGGALIRGLHHWGASCMIVVVVLHMVQTFLWGTYKKPREATWIIGVVLLLLTLAFGLTGYLLPWDNRAYWGTIITTEIAGLMPVLGQYAQRLLGAENGSIGNITFARFYTAHVMLLPAAMALLATLHVILVRKHGVAPAPADSHKPKKKFYPEQVFKDTVAIFGYVMVVALFANFAKLGLGSMADPTDSQYIPRPEWYFLFLFQLLKSFQGPLELVGAVILPNLAIGLLFLVPFLDRGKSIRVAKRTTAITIVVLSAIGWAALTQRAIATTPPSTEDLNAGLKPPQPWREVPPAELAAIGYFEKGECGSCHVLGRSTPGPDLAHEPSFKSPEWLLEHFAHPSGTASDEMAPESKLSRSEMNALVTLVTRRGEAALETWANPPEGPIQGAEIYHARGCGFCHTINEMGGRRAPVLNGLAARRTREWVMGHFADPAGFSPGSTMPAYKFDNEQLQQITDYLMAIPK